MEPTLQERRALRPGRGGPGASASASIGAAQRLHRQGRVREAAQTLQRVLASDPDHLAALHGLAMIEAGRGAPAAALPLIDRAAALAPGDATVHHLRAGVLQALGRIEEATAGYETALRLQPDLAAAASNLGGLLAAQGRHEAALPWLRRAIASQPDFAEAHNNLGVSLLALGDAEAALAQFDRALALRPDFADALGNRGSALVSAGRIDEAAGAFERAVGLAPDNGRFYLDLVSCRRLAEDDPTLAAMRRLAGQPGAMGGESRVELHFALARALEGLGDFAGSFRQLRQGNALKRIGLRYDEAAVLETMQAIARCFDARFVEAVDAAGFASEIPVFVVGMPRSGTTLVEQILASHSDVFGAGEPTALHDAAREVLGRDVPSAALFQRLAALPAEALQRIGSSYVASLKRMAPRASKIVDKLPGNFLLLGLIARVLPQARIIHVLRDPLDTCFSCFATLFSGEQPYAYNLAELGRYYRGYAGLMRHWRATLPPGRMLDISYESLVGDLEAQTRRMLAHCGLPWDPRCLQFERTVRSVQTASRVQVRQGLYRSSVGRAARYGALLDPLRAALAEGPR